jgi:hypothetical protein
LSYIADHDDRTGAFFERCRNARSTEGGERFWLGVGVEAPPGAVAIGDGFAAFRHGPVLSGAAADDPDLAKAADMLVRLCAGGAVSARGQFDPRSGAEHFADYFEPGLLVGAGPYWAPIRAQGWHTLRIYDFDGSGPRLYDRHTMPGGPSSDQRPAILDVAFLAAELERACVLLTAPRLSKEQQSAWLKNAFTQNPLNKEESMAAYGKRIADLGELAGAAFLPGSVVARYYQLHPRTDRLPRRNRKSQD